MYPSTNRTEMYRQQHHQQQQQQYLPQQQHHFPLYNQQYLPSPQQHQQQSFQPQPVNYPLQSQPSYHGSYYPQYLNGNDPVSLARNHPAPLAPAVHPVLVAASLQPRQQLGSRHQAEAAASFFRTQAQPPPRLARLPSLGSETEEEPELATNFRWILSQ